MKSIITCLLLLLVTSHAVSQGGLLAGTNWNVTDGSVTYLGEDIKHYISPITASTEAQTSMLQLDFRPLFGFLADRSGGIIADITPGSRVTLSVFSYNPANGGSKGGLVYKVFAENSSTVYTGHPETVLANIMGSNQLISSDQILILAGASNVMTFANDEGNGECATFASTWNQTFFTLQTGYFFLHRQPDCKPGKNYTTIQPVVVELSIEGTASVKRIKIPGMGELVPTKVFKPELLGHRLLVRNAMLDSAAHSFSCNITNPNSNPVEVHAMKLALMKQTQPSETTISTHDFTPFPNTFLIQETKSYSTGDVAFATDPGVYTAFVEYTYKVEEEAYATTRVPATFYRVLSAGQQDVYEVFKSTYSGVPIFQLSGGMSAEYGVEKSLSELSSGVSHTWAVRNINGQPDLAGGGPVSVYSTPDFLDKSVKKTVSLYNTHLGSTTKFKTVLIGTGVPCVPYMSFAMKAPFLPMHFLAAQNSLAEVRMMLHHANENGYSAYATAGYDPSIPGEGVAWLKLLDLPQAYKQFLIDHEVENVIFVGMDQEGAAEGVAARVVSKETFDLNDYAPMSLYLMKHGPITEYSSRYTDLTEYSTEPSQNLADWESGIPDTIIRNFSNTIRATLPAMQIAAIKSGESIQFYNLATLFALESWKKNSVAASSIKEVAINEYLIGYPASESWKGKIPFLYWQDRGLLPYTVDRLTNTFLQPRVHSYYDGLNMTTGLVYHINAKYDRSAYQNAFISDGELGTVTMNTWQKADVWDPSDGMNAPCEVLADAIKTDLPNYQAWVNNLQPLEMSDLIAMSSTQVELRDKASTHPAPASTNTLASGNGFVINEENFTASDYWQKVDYSQQIDLDRIDTVGETHIGWLDGTGRKGPPRYQRVITTEFDLSNASDEYDLRVGYKFHPTPEDGFSSYIAKNGDEQEMDCFEYTRVPKNRWMDIPSRMMERNGAIWCVNGSVYDFDYNGIPGVVPFIKKDSVIKAQPQILSFKGEGCFAWKWGANKQATLFARPTEIPDSTLSGGLANLFRNETSAYRNALAGMTYMSGPNQYDIKTLQPQWMINYPEFPEQYTGFSNTMVRCLLSNPSFGACKNYILEYGMAPENEGWNDCSKLISDDHIKRFSTLAYRQYDNTFDYYPNSRTFVAMKGNKLSLGIVDGELGNGNYAFTKRSGMTNWELNNYFRHKGYDKLINLDGGSSSQIWYNGRGPLHDWKGYPLDADNQGPYYSRLVSSFLMLVPKLHTDEVKAFSTMNNHCRVLDNSSLTFDYNENMDHSKDKAFISFGPCLKMLSNISTHDTIKYKYLDPDYSAVGGNFKITNTGQAEGAILYSIGEDTYYEDTEGEHTVVPQFRNITVMGVGKMPGKLRDSLVKMSTWDANQTVTEHVRSALLFNTQVAYFVSTYDNKIVQFFVKYSSSGSGTSYMDNTWHSFLLRRKRANGQSNFVLSVDGVPISESPSDVISYSYDGDINSYPLKIDVTHAAIGMANVDGRFVTGNARLVIDNFLLISGKEAMDNFPESDFITIEQFLHNSRTLPPLAFAGQPAGSKYYLPGVYALSFEETNGSHSFSFAKNPNEVRLYGLNLNTGSVDPDEDTSGALMTRAEQPAVEKTVINSKVTVHPNPTTGMLYVNLLMKQSGNVRFEVVDPLGRTLYYQRKYLVNGRQFVNLDLSSIRTNGTYILKINGAGGIRENKLFMLSR